MRHAALLAALLLVASAARADKVTLKNGRTLDGEVILRDEGRVHLRIQGTVTTLREDQIASIETSAPWENKLLLAESDLRGGDLPGGMRALRDALCEGAPAADVEARLERLSVSMLLAIENLDGGRRASFRDATLEVARDASLTSGTRFLLAQGLHRAGDSAAALGQLRILGPAWLREDESRLRWTEASLRREVRELAVDARFEDAIERIEFFNSLTLRGTGPLPIVHLVRAAQARDRGDDAEALRVLARDLSPLLPEVARNRAIIVLARVREQARANARFADSRRAIAEGLDAFPIEAAAALREVVALEAQHALDRNRADHAYDVLSALPASQRTPELDALLLESDYQRRMLALDRKDPLAIAEAARWCADAGLLDEALRLYETARESPAVREVADLEISTIRRERDGRKLAEALDLYDKGRLAEARHILDAIIAHEGAGGTVLDEARRMRDVITADLVIEERRRPYMAEALYQQAERAYFTERLDDALAMAQVILKQYADTPAAKRAKVLLPDVLRALRIAVVEGRRDTIPVVDFDLGTEEIQSAEALDAELRILMGEDATPPDAGTRRAAP